MVSLLKEQENFLRNAILTVDHSKEALQCFLEQHLKNNHQTFEDFLNQNQHDIYHLYYDAKCCQCAPGPLQRKKRILFASQMELLFDKNRQLSFHKTTRRSDFCCCYAKKNVTTAVLDLTLARCLRIHCCIDMFWYSCLTFKGVTLEQFLNSNKHILYHLWKSNNKCCKCQPDFIFPSSAPIIIDSEWNQMFSSTLPPCENDRKRPETGAISVCAFTATPSITVQQIHLEVQNIIIQYCCSTRKSVEKLGALRHLTFGHVKKASMSCTDFNTYISVAEEAILDLSMVFGKEDYNRQILLGLRDKPLDARMFRQYEKVLLQMISNYEDTINYNEVLKDGIDSLTEKIEKLDTSQREGSKRQRLIGETSVEIDNHRKDQTYTEIKAVTACVQILDNNRVLILTGREGSGKSRNSLEILRRIKEKHQETDVIKLKRLTEFTDIIEKEAMTIVLFEDVFGRITKQFCENTDIQILDSLHSYISLGNVKVIFVMRNNVKHECQSILSSHELFRKNIAYLDLSSKKFGLSLKEKEQIFINYCTQNRIEIIYKDEHFYPDAIDIQIDKIKVPIVDKPDVSCRSSADNTCLVFNFWSVEDMIRSDPYQGFPKYCRLFTQNKKITTLGANFFECPLKSLLQEIESMRMEGLDNRVNGLKYVILVYILLNQSSSVRSTRMLSRFDNQVFLAINENSIDVQAHQKLFNECYSEHFRLKLHDIMNLYEELACKYLTRKDNKIYFQHRALQDIVLISYYKINPKAIIPLLSIDHMTYLVRPQNYMEQENEMVIKISKSNYYVLAKMIISLMNSELYDRSYRDRFMESKIITDTDVDLINELLGCINNPFDTLLSLDSYTRHYFPLYLLRNIRNLDDNELTVNHTKDEMLISVTIGDKSISLGIDPNISLSFAFQSKYIDTIEWLFKNTDHALMNFKRFYRNCNIGVEGEALTYVEYMQLLFENVKHEVIDTTQLFTNICLSNKAEHAIDWIVDNVDNSLICYDKCIDTIFKTGYFEFSFDLIVYLLKKVNQKLLNINNVVNKTCQYGTSHEILKVLQIVDPELLNKDELFKTLIPVIDNDEGCWKIIVELSLPLIRYSDFNRLVEKADGCRLYGVLELLITHVTDLSIDIVQLIKKIYTLWDAKDAEQMEGNYNKHKENVLRLLLKHHIDKIGVSDIIIDKACHVGSHRVVEKLLMDKIDNISYYLNITLDKCVCLRFDEIYVSNGGGYGKLIMLFIQKIDNQCIDLNSLMNDLCNIGHSSAVLWLLENKQSHCFDLRNIMNKAFYHGDLALVQNLKQNYKAGDFDYQTAMIKACRHAQRNTLGVCKWLWENIDRNVFNMQAVLNNASRYGNTEVVIWILTDVDKGLYDTESALLCACENGEDDTVELLLDYSCINMIDIQSAITIACRNEHYGLNIIENITEWIIENCNQNTTETETETNDGQNCVDKAVTFILDMEAPEQQQDNVNKKRKLLLEQILTNTDPSIVHIYKLLTESCKYDWVEIFQWILEKVDHACLNIGEIINVACRNGSLDIIEWSLKNIDIQLVDVDNVMVLRWKHFYQYELQDASTEPFSYGHLGILERLLHDVHDQLFDISILLQEAGRNGWINFFGWLLQNFHLDKSAMHIATSQALENGHLEIAELVLSEVGKEGFDFSSLSDNAFVGANKEGVVIFLLHNIDRRTIDIATIMTNACLFGWKKVAAFIVDNDLISLCDLPLAFNTACDNGELEIAQLLLDQVDPHILTSVDKAMHSVALKGWDKIAILLLENVEHTQLDIGNAFIEACRHGEIDVVQAVLQKVDTTMLDVKTAVDKACENHMHEELVLWMLENFDQEQVDLKSVKKQAVRHKWKSSICID